MEFEYDPAKSTSNALKHGIDFEDAKALWSDFLRIEIPANNTDEPRFLIIGKINDKMWSAIVTDRQGKIRIISVRRSRREEEVLYECQ